MNKNLAPTIITQDTDRKITNFNNIDGNSVNILNESGATVNFISVRKNNILDLSNFRFKLDKYNLVAIDERFEEYGEFYMQKDKLNSNLSKKDIKELIKYPTLLCEINANYKTSGNNQKARICKLVSFEILNDSIKFKYIVCKEFNQKIINENEMRLGIPSSENTNTLDHKSWNTINLNLFKILKLEAEYGKD